MTIKQAYRAALRPYVLPNDSMELVLLQHGFVLEDDYAIGNENEFYSAVVDGLIMLITLVKEKDAGSENQYDTDKIEDRINFIKRKWGIEDENEDDAYGFIDRTSEW